MKIRTMIVCLISVLIYSSKSYAVSPADVFHQVRLINVEIEALKQQKAPDKAIRVPGIQIGKTAVHAYTKGLELLEKIQRYQRRYQLPLLTIPDFPKKRVKSKHLLALMTFTEQEIKKITAPLNLKTATVKADKKSKTASDVYELIWRGSYIMDALIEPIKPADVIRNGLMIESGLIAIGKKLNKDVVLPAAKSYTDKKPVDVTIQLYKMLYTLAKLERKLKLKPLIVPVFPAGEIKPEDAYDASGNVLSDISRILIKLKIDSVKRIDVPQVKVTPNDVYAQVERLNSAAQSLLK